VNLFFLQCVVGRPFLSSDVLASAGRSVGINEYSNFQCDMLFIEFASQYFIFVSFFKCLPARNKN